MVFPIWEIFAGVVSIVVYILYIRHKYRKFPPGPYGLPIVGYLPFLGPRPYMEYGEIAKKYGDGKIFSLTFGNLPIVILNDLELIRKAFKNDVFSGRPKSVLAVNIISNGLTFSEGQVWQEQRSFTMKTLKQLGFGKSSLEDLIRDDVSKLIEHLRKQVGKPISLKKFLEISVINTLWTIVASETHALDDPDIHRLHKLSFEGFIEPKLAGPVWFMPWLAKLAPDSTGLTSLTLAVKNLRQFARDLIARKQLNYSANNLQDFVDYYLKEIEETTDPNSSFFGEKGIMNLMDLLINLFVAGSDPTSSTICWGFLYLLHYPEVMDRVRNEIDEAVGRNQMPTMSDRIKMPYTEATVNEIFRMSSVVAGGVLHSTLEDTEFEGYLLPKSTIVLANFYHAHHDAAYWGDPQNFRPERFLGPDGKFKKDDKLMAFSSGKRICPAEHLGTTNVFLNLTGIIQNFDIEFSKEDPIPSMEPQVAIVFGTQPYKVVLRERTN